MTDTQIGKIRDYIIKMLDIAIQKTESFIKRMEKIEKEIDEAQQKLEKGDKIGFEHKRLELSESFKNEYLFANQMMLDIQKMEQESEKIETYEKQLSKIHKKIIGNNLNPKELISYLEFNKENDKEIANNIVGKQVVFKGHKLQIRGYEQGKILIERIGSIEAKNLAKALEFYVISVDGIEVEDALTKIREIRDEEQLRQYLKNKILKHKNYKAKIYDYKDMKLRLVIRADNKFVNGWIPANKPALDKAVETLAKYNKEHIQQKLERYQPFGIKSLAQLESVPTEKRKQIIQNIPKWRGLDKEDKETIEEALSLQLQEA
jgi:cell division septum initiation protein DivIVA